LVKNGANYGHKQALCRASGGSVYLRYEPPTLNWTPTPVFEPLPHRMQIAPPELLYVQVIKHREPGHVIAVINKVVFGTRALIAERLAASEASVVTDTSGVQHENLMLRCHSRRLTGKTIAF
jgi:hypothetical protein